SMLVFWLLPYSFRSALISVVSGLDGRFCKFSCTFSNRPMLFSKLLISSVNSSAISSSLAMLLCLDSYSSVPDHLDGQFDGFLYDGLCKTCWDIHCPTQKFHALVLGNPLCPFFLKVH